MHKIAFVCENRSDEKGTNLLQKVGFDLLFIHNSLSIENQILEFKPDLFFIVLRHANTCGTAYLEYIGSKSKLPPAVVFTTDPHLIPKSALVKIPPKQIVVFEGHPDTKLILEKVAYVLKLDPIKLFQKYNALVRKRAPESGFRGSNVIPIPNERDLKNKVESYSQQFNEADLPDEVLDVQSVNKKWNPISRSFNKEFLMDIQDQKKEFVRKLFKKKKA